MKKRLPLIVLLILVGAGTFAWLEWSSVPDASRLTLYGNVDIREVELGFRVAGRLQSMHMEEGDAVVAGTLLAALDDKPQRESLAVAEARVGEAHAHLDRLNTGSRPQEIQQAQARVQEAEAALASARHELKRQRELTQNQLSSQQLLDAAVSIHDQAQARLLANREALALVVEGPRREDIAAAEAVLAVALAQRDQANTQLGDTRLYAPNSGVIMTRAREPGAILGVGAPVYMLSLTDTVYLRAYVDEPNLGRVRPGTQVQVRTDSNLDTGGKHSYRGQVGFISPRAEFTPKAVETPALRTDLVYRLRIVVTDADEGLRQGMPVTIEFPEDEQSDDRSG